LTPSLPLPLPLLLLLLLLLLADHHNLAKEQLATYSIKLASHFMHKDSTGPEINSGPTPLPHPIQLDTC
jgi:hypothetical protein